MQSWKGIFVIAAIVALGVAGYLFFVREDPCVTVNIMKRQYRLDSGDPLDFDRPTASDVMPERVLRRYERAAVACSRSFR